MVSLAVRPPNEDQASWIRRQAEFEAYLARNPQAVEAMRAESELARQNIPIYGLAGQPPPSTTAANGSPAPAPAPAPAGPDPDIEAALDQILGPGGVPAPVGPSRPPGPPLNPAYVPPALSRLVAPEQPTNPNLGNAALFTPQDQTPEGWAGQQEEALQGVAARQNMREIVEGNVPPSPDEAPPIAEWVMDNPGAAATIPFAATPIGAWRVGAGVAGNLARTFFGGAALGGTAGGIDAAADGENVAAGALRGAGFGGALGAAVPAFGSGLGWAVGKLFGLNAASAAARPLVAIQGEYGQLRDQARSMGLTLDPQAARSWVTNAESGLRQGFAELNHALPYNALRDIQDDILRNPTVLLDDLENWRQRLRNARLAAGNDADEAAMTKLISDFDSWMDGLAGQPGAVLAGNAADAVGLLQQARASWQVYRKAADVDAILAKAEFAPDPNVFVRARFRRIAQDDRFRQFWSPEEQAAITKIVNGGSLENIADLLAMLSPTNRLGASLAVGAGGATLGLTGSPQAAGVVTGALSGAGALGNAGQMIARSQIGPRAAGLSEAIRTPASAPAAWQDVLARALTAGGRLAGPQVDQRFMQSLDDPRAALARALAGGNVPPGLLAP